MIIGATLYLTAGLLSLWLGSAEMENWARFNSSYPNDIFYRKGHKHRPMTKVLSDIIEESESKPNIDAFV